MPVLETERTILRPFTLNDAADVYAYCKDPRVGPIAGWKPHESEEESREIIRTVFSAPDVFAVTDRGQIPPPRIHGGPDNSPSMSSFLPHFPGHKVKAGG